MATTTAAITPTSPFVGMASAACTNTSAHTAITAIADTLTAPTIGLSGEFFTAAPPGGGLVLFMFAGTASDNGTATCRIITWHKLTQPGSTTVQYHPQWVGDLALTFGSVTGITGGIVPATYRYVDTITVSNDGGIGPNRIRVVGRDGTGSQGTPAADNGTMWVAIDRLNADFITLSTRGTGSVTDILPFMADVS